MFGLDVFHSFAERDIAAARIWLGKLSGISQNAMDAILAEVPPQRMSPVARRFTNDQSAPVAGKPFTMNALLVASRSADATKGGWSPIGRLEFDQGTYRFVYTKGAKTAAGFTPFSGMEDLEEIYESNELFPVFANRLLPKSRSEYVAFLRWSGFDPANPPDPIAVLGVTEGIRRTDMIEVFPRPVEDEPGCYLSNFFLHGLRYMPEVAKARVLSLEQDEPLYPMLDLCNPADRNAVALRTVNGDRLMLGYVPRYLAHDVWKLLQDCDPDFIQVFVHRVNPDAPLQQRLLCRMHACWPEGFQPCGGEEFQPIPKGIPERCAV